MSLSDDVSEGAKELSNVYVCPLCKKKVFPEDMSEYYGQTMCKDCAKEFSHYGTE